MKIKKYTIYIFLLVVLFGFFSSAVDVNAQSTGYCSITPINTRTACVGAGGIWTPVVSSTGVPTYSSLNSSIDACADLDGLGKIICQINKLLGAVVPLLLALGMVYFIWGVVQYVIGGDGEDKKKGRDRIIYGLIGLSVILGVWGLVNIVVGTFGLGGTPNVEIPLVPESLNNSSCGSLPDRAKLQDLLCYLTAIINDAVIPLIFALAMVVFLWGVVQFVINSDDEAKKTKGKQFMIWGIIALAVMVSVWGLVNILGTTFGIDSSFLPRVRP